MKSLSQKSLDYRIYKFLTEFKMAERGDHIVVACSGGPDSVVLLKILLELREKLNITVSACHYNHQMRGEESDRDQAFVEKISAEWGIECVSGSAPKKRILKSEDEARRARYDFFEKIKTERGECKIALGHTLSDNVETLLMRLIRGTGLLGATAIPHQRDFFIRPIIQISRTEVLAYAKLHRLPYLVDSSNLKNDFLRNKIRNVLIPELQEINPQVEESLNNFIVSANRDYDYIITQAEAIFQKVAQVAGDNIMINRSDFLALPAAIQYQIIRISLDKIDTNLDITRAQIDEVVMMIVKGEGNKRKNLPRALRVELVSGKIEISK
ncbi:MAG: tRNA lysidine(34) synthetase TilS [Candidatus Berkelbacteria bacterium]